MARPPRFQRRRSPGRRLPGAAGGFVNQVRNAMSQIQKDLEDAATEARQAKGAVSRDAANVAQDVRDLRLAAKNLPAKLRQELKQKARAELKRRLTGASADERPRARRRRTAAQHPRSTGSLESATLEGASIEGRSLEGDSLESGTLEGDTLEGAVETGLESPVTPDQGSPETPLLQTIRQTLASPRGIQQAWIFSEILGKPPGLR